MQYKVYINLTIRTLDGLKSSTGYKEITLPFVPFIGLQLSDRLGPSQPIASVTWSEKEQMFFCHIEDGESKDTYPEIDFDFLVKNAKRSNWLGFDLVNDES